MRAVSHYIVATDRRKLRTLDQLTQTRADYPAPQPQPSEDLFPHDLISHAVSERRRRLAAGALWRAAGVQCGAITGGGDHEQQRLLLNASLQQR